MVQRVASNDAALRMPPGYLGHEKLSDREIGLITRWVDQGAKWQKHWSFITAGRPARPSVRKTDWPKSEMDFSSFSGSSVKGCSRHRKPTERL